MLSPKSERNKLRRKQKIHAEASTSSSRATTPDIKISQPSPIFNKIVLSPVIREPSRSPQYREDKPPPVPPKAPAHYRSRAISDPRGGPLRRLGHIRSPEDLACIAESGHESHGTNSPVTRSPLIPEFAHLSQTASSATTGRHSQHKQNLSTSSIPIRERRYAKTPIRSIEQLEALSPRTAHKVSSVDLIAESYCALIDSDRSLLQATPTPPDDGLLLRQAVYNPGDRSPHLKETVVVATDFEPATPESATLPATVFNPDSIYYNKQLSPRQTGSPLSDAGTLVAQEDSSTGAIYFKPSFSPGATPHVNDFVQQGSVDPTPPLGLKPQASLLSIDKNPGLSICMDLLSRELLSATGGNPRRPGSETSALQLQAMIEAYENLRDRAGQLGLGAEQEGMARDMFDAWLGALQQVQAKIRVRELPTRAAERRRPGGILVDAA